MIWIIVEVRIFYCYTSNGVCSRPTTCRHAQFLSTQSTLSTFSIFFNKILLFPNLYAAYQKLGKISSWIGTFENILSCHQERKYSALKVSTFFLRYLNSFYTFETIYFWIFTRYYLIRRNFRAPSDIEFSKTWYMTIRTKNRGWV